jgi:type IV secretion system protein VirD4
MMGKETIYLLNTSETKGNSPSFSNSYQKLGRELMTADELAAMDSDSCILMLRGLRPFMSKKYDITRHPLYKQLADYDRRNRFDTGRFLSTKLKVRPSDSFTAYEDDEKQGDELPEPPPPEAFAAPPAQSS